MSKELTCFISFVLVLGIAAASPAGLDDDPNLAGWWKFDGDTSDSSGNGRNGSLAGDAKLISLGLLDGALELDGNGDYVTIDGYKGVLADADGVQQPFTITAWVKTTDGGDRTIASWGTNSNRLRVDFRLGSGRLRVEHGAGNVQGDTTLNDGDWHHVALTMIQGATVSYPDVVLWLDGKDNTRASTDPDAFSITAGVDMAIGYRATAAARYFLGTIDEVRLYNRLLDASEVAELAKRPKSYDPDPADGALIEELFVLLQWTPGGFAVEHDVYFGTNPSPGPAEFAVRQAAASYLATGLVPGQAYYWRVDDVKDDGTVVTGDTWTFSTPPRGAYNPSPPDGTINAATDVTLNWAASWNPAMYRVYFGTDADAVANAVAAPLQTTVGFDPGPLQPKTTYYWRVDVVYTLGLEKGPVWSFSTMPDIPLTDDPNLVAHWSLDEGAGRTALDMSGHGNHGILNGDPQWVGGQLGGALEFDGSGGDYVEAPESSRVTGTRSRTVAAWIKTSDYGEIVSWGQNVAGQKWIFRVQESNGTLGAIRIEVNGGYQVGNTDVRDNEWHHVAAVLVDDGSPDAMEIALYVDDAQEAISAQLDEPINTAAGPVRIGESPWHNRPFNGLIDEVRIYDRAFTPEEIRQTLGNPLLAYNPQPAIGAVGDIWRLALLSWTAGDGAVEHDVYLGTNKAAVAAADTSDTTGIYRGRQAETAHVPADGLAWLTTYYWRVDELAADGTVSKGRIWTFTTTDNIVLYDVETPFPYDNSVPPHVSEISLDLDPAQDWSGGCNGGIGSLAISYTGQAAPGSVTQTNGTYTVVGRGADIWGTADQFQFAHTMLTGTGSLIVKVESLISTDNWTKAGIMIRETLAPGSPFAAVYATGANGVRFQARVAADQSATSDTSVATAEQKALTPPVWLMLVRQFPTVNAYYSSDGLNWTPMSWNPQVIPMSPAPIYIGLAVTSHSGENVYAEATFSNVYGSGGVATGPLASTEIGLVSNSAEPMYAVLENAAGAMGIVDNLDPAATQRAALTDWVINLDEFGIDRTAVTKATLGVGNLVNPTPGGAGVLTINNVRLLPGSYKYDGDADAFGPAGPGSLDGTWDHNNGSDSWDGSKIGEGSPGGASALVEDGVTFLRIQDTGDPRDYGMPDPSNRKVYFTRATDFGLDGVRLEVRARVATTPPLDDMHPDGGAGIVPWPAEGIGYHIRDNGKGMFGIAQDGLGIISFSLAQPGEAGFENVATDVLVMNNLVANTPSGNVDTGEAATAANVLAIADATQWNTFVIDIAAGGAGTHIVSISANGQPARSFDVTVGTGLETGKGSYITLGSSGTGPLTAFDVDYISVMCK